MAAEYNIGEDGVFIQSCPHCRGLGYVVDLIGEVRPCQREECVKAKAVEILEESSGGGRDRSANPFDDALGGILKSKLAGSFIMGGLAGVVAGMAGDLLSKSTGVPKMEEKLRGSLLPALPSRRPTSPHCAGVRCWFDNGAPCRCECEGCTQVSEWPKPYRVAKSKPAKRSKKKPSRRR